MLRDDKVQESAMACLVLILKNASTFDKQNELQQMAD
jgi:hypothetical protein